MLNVPRAFAAVASWILDLCIRSAKRSALVDARSSHSLTLMGVKINLPSAPSHSSGPAIRRVSGRLTIDNVVMAPHFYPNRGFSAR